MIIDRRSRDAPELLFGCYYQRGKLRADLEREYADDFFAGDERVPRLLELPDGLPTLTRDLYKEAERKTSRTYSDWLRRAKGQQGLSARMDGPDGEHIVWMLANLSKPSEWTTDTIETVRRLLPHIRQFIRVRRKLADAEVMGASLFELLDERMIGAIHLDRCGRIFNANVRARDFLEKGNGLSNKNGMLRALRTTDDANLQQLLAQAVPKEGNAATGGSMSIPSANTHHLAQSTVLHVVPVNTGITSLNIARVATLVLILDPSARPSIEPGFVAATLGLTRAESRVAAMLAEGNSVRDIAVSTYRAESSIRWLVKEIHAKLGINRQTELIRMILFSAWRPKIPPSK